MSGAADAAESARLERALLEEALVLRHRRGALPDAPLCAEEGWVAPAVSSPASSLLARTAAFLLHRDVNAPVAAFTQRAWLLLRVYDAPLEPHLVTRQLNVWTVADGGGGAGGTGGVGVGVSGGSGAGGAGGASGDDRKEEMERERLAMLRAMRGK